MSGRIGNTVTVNGRVPDRVAVKAGERVRLRIVNAALARIVGLRFEGHRPVVISHDGQPCEPHLSEGGRLVLGPAMRADLIIDMVGKPDQTYRVIDDFYRDLAYKLVDLAYGPERPTRDHSPSAPPRLPANPLPEPDFTAAERHEIALQGGMMGGMGMMGNGGMMSGGMMGGRGMMGGGGMMGAMGMGNTTWAMNGMSMTGDGQAEMTPLITLEIAFVANNPGDWMFHCHVTDHQESGMMSIVRIV